VVCRRSHSSVWPRQNTDILTILVKMADVHKRFMFASTAVAMDLAAIRILTAIATISPGYNARYFGTA
jgi:hypothetical protein